MWEKKWVMQMKNAFSCFIWQLNHLKPIIKEISRANFVEYKMHFETYWLKHTVILHKHCHSTYNNVMNRMQFCQNTIKIIHSKSIKLTCSISLQLEYEIVNSKFTKTNTEVVLLQLIFTVIGGRKNTLWFYGKFNTNPQFKK